MTTSRSGSSVHARVIALISAVVAMGAQQPLTNDSATPRVERVLAALVDFKDVDEAQRHFSHEDIIKLLEQNNDSLERFTWETSRNLINVDFDVLDWITVDKNRTDYPLGGGDLGGVYVVEDAISAISYHADLGQYDKVLLFIYPLEQGYPGCQAYLGPVRWRTPNGTFDLGAAWLSGYDMGCVKKGRIAHEYMHTFGFVHSLLVSCSKEPSVPASLIDPTDKNDSCFEYLCVDDDCTETRPGDASIYANVDWDVLGGDHEYRYEELFPLHVHATWQAQAGWLGEDQVIETSARGSYRITTLESLDSGPKAVRVPLGLNHRGEPAYYWLQTREFSPWTLAFRRSVEDLSPCQVDVRLEATTVFRSEGWSTDLNNTYIFGDLGGIHGESIVRPRRPFHDPYRGIRMKIADCVEGRDRTAIDVLIETTPLTVGSPIVAHLYDEQTTATITVTNGGTRTVSVGSAAIGGRHPDAFSVLSDGCGQLQLGVSCAIVVSYDGGTVGNPNHHAVLKIPNDDELAPQLSVSLFGEVGRAEAANRRPVVLENLPDRSLAAVGTLEVDVSGAFVDPDGEALSYTVSSSAPEVVATRVAGTVVTLTAASQGVAAIRVTATDPGGLSATQSFGVTVGRPNRPPEPVGVLPAVTLGVDEAPVMVEVSGAFRDPDGDLLTYGAASSSPSVALVAVSGSTVTVTPVSEGTATVTVTATDAGGSNGTATQPFAVTVGPAANRPPEVVGVLAALTLGVDDAAVTVEVTSAFRDPDGDALSYGATSSAPDVVTARAAGTRVTLAAIGAGTATIEVTATDPDGLSATQSFQVRVTAPFTDDPIVPGVTPVRAVHFTELRGRIDVLRSEAGLARFRWTDPELRARVTRVRRVHLLELRAALVEAYRASGRSAPRWTDTSPAAGTTPIRAAHVTELRAAVLALE